MRRNLVTGGSGFLGSHLVEALVARAEEVRVLVRSTSDVTRLEELGVDLVTGDLSDPASLQAAARGVERIYHCAALASDWGTWETFRAANVTGVRNVLEAALAAGVHKFIHVSTTGVYGHPDYPADETAPYRQRGWPYGDTKIEGEQLVWAYYQEYGLPVTVARPASIYGPRSVTFVTDFVELLQQRSLPHIGRKQKPAGLAYVTNVVDFLLLIADSEQSVGEAYNVSDGLDISWRQYVNRLAEMVGAPQPRLMIPYRLAYLVGWLMEQSYRMLRIRQRPLLTRLAVELLGTTQGFPIDKARRQLGYEPRVGFEEGMDRIKAWLRQTGTI